MTDDEIVDDYKRKLYRCNVLLNRNSRHDIEDKYDVWHSLQFNELRFHPIHGRPELREVAHKEHEEHFSSINYKPNTESLLRWVVSNGKVSRWRS